MATLSTLLMTTWRWVGWVATSEIRVPHLSDGFIVAKADYRARQSHIKLTPPFDSTSTLPVAANGNPRTIHMQQHLRKSRRSPLRASISLAASRSAPEPSCSLPLLHSLLFPQSSMPWATTECTLHFQQLRRRSFRRRHIRSHPRRRQRRSQPDRHHRPR